MGRIAVFVYGVAVYVVFLATFVYAIGFVGNIAVTKSIDSGTEAKSGQALIVNCGLLALFAVQHSVMARKGFKKWWTRIIPEPAERSTFVFVSSVSMVLLFHKWQGIPSTIWDVQNPIASFILSGLFCIGWLIILVSFFIIDHFDQFGLRQTYLFLRGTNYTPLGFTKPSLYRLVRHPQYLGIVIAFWSTPRMTSGHLLFAVASTAYMLIGIQLEERDLIRDFGQAYRNYRQQVPMLLPLPRKK